MSHAKDVLADQLLANANDRSWYVSFLESTANITEEDAFWKPDKESNSIAEIVQHLLYWNETWQKRYKKSHMDAVPPLRDNNESFVIKEDRSFADLKACLLAVLLQWQELLTEEIMDQEVHGFPVNAKWWGILGNLTTHNSYHIGQIVYIRKLQKSWDRKFS